MRSSKNEILIFISIQSFRSKNGNSDKKWLSFRTSNEGVRRNPQSINLSPKKISTSGRDGRVTFGGDLSVVPLSKHINTLYIRTYKIYFPRIFPVKNILC